VMLMQDARHRRFVLARLLKPAKRPLLIVASWVLVVSASTVCFAAGGAAQAGELALFASSFAIASVLAAVVALLIAGNGRLGLEAAFSVVAVVICCALAYWLLRLNVSLFRRFIGYGELLTVRFLFERIAEIIAKVSGPIGGVAGSVIGLAGGVAIRLSRRRPLMAGALAVGLLLALASGPVLPTGAYFLANFVIDARAEHARHARRFPTPTGVRNDEIAAALGGTTGAIAGAVGAWLVARASRIGRQGAERRTSRASELG
jgi:hypothetical protein